MEEVEPRVTGDGLRVRRGRSKADIFEGELSTGSGGKHFEGKDNELGGEGEENILPSGHNPHCHLWC